MLWFYSCKVHVFFHWVPQDAATPTLKSVVALLKLGDWDPDVFYKFRDTILNQVRVASRDLIERAGG